MVEKGRQGLSMTQVDMNEYQNIYVPEMDKSAQLLKKQKFNSIDDAYLVLSQMIRSFCTRKIRKKNDRHRRAEKNCSFDRR